jgi:septum formation inhibitor-activating ATPase MinD
MGATDRLTKEIENISRGISRIVAITGHRGSGLTSTAVNIACEAGKRGLRTVIVDMDVEYRSTNMYFSRFHEQSQRHEDISASLIRSLARPQDYMTTAFNINDNLWLISLGYSFHDKRLMEQFYNNNKLIGLLSVLRTKFNLVILDMPLDLFRTFRESMIHMDMFGLCVSNNLHSILSTLRNVEVVLDQEAASYLNAKSKLIVTRYNDRSRFQREILTPDKVSEVMTSGLSDRFTYEISVAGSVPYSNDFDSQIESDVPVVNANADYESAYGNILLRLMEGVK